MKCHRLTVLATLAAVLFVYFAHGAFYSFGCKNTILEEHPSPANLNTAILFERDCGATTAYSLHISVIDSRQKLGNKPGNVFIMGTSDNFQSEKAQVGIAWNSEKSIAITYRKDAKVFRNKSSHYGLRILYSMQ